MTMYIAVDLHEFVFFAADKRVTTRSQDGVSTFSDDVVKLNVISGGIITGCGLENVVERVGNAMSGSGFTLEEKNQINVDYPTPYLNATRVVIAPKQQPENQRLLSLHFGEHQTDRFFDFEGGLVDGSSGITQEHRQIVMQASADYVRNRGQIGRFEHLLEQIGHVFECVSQVSDEVSNIFDYALQYPDGRQSINETLVTATGT